MKFIWEANITNLCRFRSHLTKSPYGYMINIYMYNCVQIFFAAMFVEASNFTSLSAVDLNIFQVNN